MNSRPPVIQDVSKVVFWQNELSDLQSAHIRALAERPKLEVIWVALQELGRSRRKLGLEIPDVGKAKPLINPSNAEALDLVAGNPASTVHIFNGLRGWRRLSQLLSVAAANSAYIGIQTEPRPLRGISGFVRRQAHARAFHEIANHLHFVLAMGYGSEDGGRVFFEKLGVPDEIVFPYGYFRDPPDEPPLDPAPGKFRFVYVGQLVRRKGCDLLLRALSQMEDLPWVLDLVGSGDSQKDLAKLAAHLHISDRVNFLGSHPQSKVQEFVSRSDLLVLPSRFDGWGLVTNEALYRGLPVVCSHRCGSMDLLGESYRGSVFTSGSVTELVECLRSWCTAGKRDTAASFRRYQWSKSISGKSMADYMWQVIEYSRGKAERPQAHWMIPTGDEVPGLGRADKGTGIVTS